MNKKILVVDDEADICNLLRHFLEQHGFKTYTATDPEEGLRIFDRERPYLVLLDILMPKVSGMDCLGDILKKEPKTIVVILSGVKDEAVAKGAILEGAYDYISKPFDWKQFEEQILTRVYTDYGG